MSAYSEQTIREYIQPRFAVRYVLPEEALASPYSLAGFAFFNSVADARDFRDALNSKAGERAPTFEAFDIETGAVVA